MVSKRVSRNEFATVPYSVRRSRGVRCEIGTASHCKSKKRRLTTALWQRRLGDTCQTRFSRVRCERGADFAYVIARRLCERLTIAGYILFVVFNYAIKKKKQPSKGNTASFTFHFFSPHFSFAGAVEESVNYH